MTKTRQSGTAPFYFDVPLSFNFFEIASILFKYTKTPSLGAVGAVVCHSPVGCFPAVFFLCVPNPTGYV